MRWSLRHSQSRRDCSKSGQKILLESLHEVVDALIHTYTHAYTHTHTHAHTFEYMVPKDLCHILIKALDPHRCLTSLSGMMLGFSRASTVPWAVFQCSWYTRPNRNSDTTALWPDRSDSFQTLNFSPLAESLQPGSEQLYVT